jgi:hypothetical protein
MFGCIIRVFKQGGLAKQERCMRAMSVVRLRRTGEVHAGNERCEVKTDRRGTCGQ